MNKEELFSLTKARQKARHEFNESINNAKTLQGIITAYACYTGKLEGILDSTEVSERVRILYKCD